MLKKLIFIVFIVISSFSFLGCQSKQHDISQESKIDPLEIIITPEIQKQIKIDTVKKVNLTDAVNVPGRIEVQQSRLAKIGSPVVGRISDIRVTLGQEVKQNEVLAKVNSVELTQMQLAYIKAKQQIELKTKAFERAELLFNAGVISKAEMLRIQTELEAVKAEFNASEDQLEILGMTKGAIQKLKSTSQIDSYSDVTSRIAGHVITKHVNIGQVVQPADELFSVADLSHLWAVAEIPEQQVAYIQVDQEVNIDIPALEDKRVKGKIIFVSNIVNPETRTVMVRTDIENSNQALKPDMLITMMIQSKKISKIAVPLSAIVRENDHTYIFVKTAENRFRLREVDLGNRDGEMVSVVNGIALDETIVTDGAFHLNNERKKKELE